MAWLLWLLAPLASTALGANLLWARARRERRAGAITGIEQHHRLLKTLSDSCATQQPEPANLTMLTEALQTARVPAER